MLEECIRLINERQHELALACLKKRQEDMKGAGADEYYLLATCYFYINKLDESFQLLGTVEELSEGGKNAVATYSKGQILEKQNKFAEAIRHYDKAAVDLPEGKSAEASFKKGICLSHLGRFEEAIESYDKAIRDSNDQKHLQASLNKGNLLTNMDRYDEAIVAYENVLREPSNKYSSLALYYAGFCLYKLGRYEEALENLNSSFRYATISNRPKILYLKGEVLIKMDRDEDGIRSSELAIQHALQQRYPEASFNRGLALKKLGRYEEAIRSYRKAIEDTPNQQYPAAFHSIGGCLAELGRYEEAVEAYNNATLSGKWEEISGSWYNKGWMLLKLERLHEAIAVFEQLISLSPGQKHPEASVRIGNALNRLGRNEEAIELYNQVIRDSEDGKNGGAFFGRAVVLTDIEDYKGALIEFEKALACEEGYDLKHVYLNRGICHYRLDNFEAAMDELDKAINEAKNGIYAPAWLEKARNLYQLSRKTEARQAVFESLNQDNFLQLTLAFIVDKFTSHLVYENRIKLIDLLNLVRSVIAVRNQGEADTIIKNFTYSGDAELYWNLLLNQKDILSIGKNGGDRLRLAYLIALSHELYEWSYYIIHYLMAEKGLGLNKVDQYFYLESACKVGVSRKELEKIVASYDYGEINWIRIDDYLYEAQTLLSIQDLLAGVGDEEERQLISHIIEKKPYQPSLSRNELLVMHLALNFSIDAELMDSSDTAFLNFVDSVNKAAPVVQQIGNNIFSLVKGGNPAELNAVLYHLTTKEIEETLPVKDALMLKAFAIFKYVIRKEKLANREFVVSKLVKGVIGTLLGGVISGIASTSFLLVLGLPFLLDFGIDKAVAKALVSRDLTWDEFVAIKRS